MCLLFYHKQLRKARLELYDQALEAANKSFIEQKTKDLSLSEKEDFGTELVEDVVQSLDTYSVSDVNDPNIVQHNLQLQAYPTTLDESMIASLSRLEQQDLNTQSDVSRVEYFAVPPNGTQLPVQVSVTLLQEFHFVTLFAVFRCNIHFIRLNIISKQWEQLQLYLIRNKVVLYTKPAFRQELI